MRVIRKMRSPKLPKKPLRPIHGTIVVGRMRITGALVEPPGARSYSARARYHKRMAEAHEIETQRARYHDKVQRVMHQAAEGSRNLVSALGEKPLDAAFLKWAGTKQYFGYDTISSYGKGGFLRWLFENKASLDWGRRAPQIRGMDLNAFRQEFDLDVRSRNSVIQRLQFDGSLGHTKDWKVTVHEKHKHAHPRDRNGN